MTTDSVVPRFIEDKLRSKLAERPAVVLTGARRMGKTLLAQKIASESSSLYLDLQKHRSVATLAGDAVDFLLQAKGKLIVLDEVQRMPGIFEQLRSAIDLERDRKVVAGKFLLLGSASGKLLRQTGEHLSGRVARLRLRGINLLEAKGLWDMDTLWERGGYPESLLASDEESSRSWRTEYLESQVGRELGELEMRIPATKVNALLERLAYLQGNPLDATKISRDLSTTRHTVMRHLDVLEELMLIRQLPHYQPGLGPDSVKRPKYYYCDSGLLHAARQINMRQLLSEEDGRLRGASWECFVIESLSSVLPNGWRMHYYRMSKTHSEIDLVLVRPGGKIWAIEIKSGIEANISAKNIQALQALQPERSFLVHRGTGGMLLAERVQAISLAGMMQVLRDEDAAPASAARAAPARNAGIARLEQAIGRTSSISALRREYLEPQLAFARELLNSVGDDMPDSNAQHSWASVRERIVQPYSIESEADLYSPERNQFYSSLVRTLQFFLDLKPDVPGPNLIASWSFAGMVAYDLYISAVAALLGNGRYETVRQLLAETYVRKSEGHACFAFWTGTDEEASFMNLLFSDSSGERRAAFVEAELIVMLYNLLEADPQLDYRGHWYPYAFWNSRVGGVGLFLKAASEHGLANISACIGDANPEHVEKCIRQCEDTLCEGQFRFSPVPADHLLDKLNVANWWRPS